MRNGSPPILPGLFLLLLTVSCEKMTTWDIQPSDRFPVVDCIITNELKVHELRLYQSSEGMNQEPEGISGAVITLSDGVNTLSFSEVEPGKYSSVVPFMASAGNEYSLAVSCQGISDTARAEMVAITPLESFEIVSYDSLFRFVYYSGNQPSMTEVFYDWSAVPGYCDAYGSCRASEVFYTLDNIDISKMFAPDRMVIPFPRGTQIIRRKYSLSEDQQQFVRSLLLETDWRGGIFDVEQGNVPTNFSGGLHGWFAACMVLSDTTYFE
ncbi:MAG: hypothetical protein H6Q21_1085 [Bacteroidetes bacterium]|nr:hypothetical protein [Bacteroidota bacterium]